MAPFRDVGCFRGQKDATKALVSTFDREVFPEISVEYGDRTMTVREALNLDENERQLLLDFQRGASHYHSPLPKKGDR
jgi:hypothetical protein